MTHNTQARWWIYSVIGLVCVGAGMCVFGEALLSKFKNEAWFWIGTLSLVLINAGLCFIGGAIVLKVKK